jgi:hypothetical protein
MSQNILATDCSVFHGISWKVEGSGRATMSDSWMRANPSIEDPSKPIPSVRAPSSSCEVIVNAFRNPRTSVNQSRTNRIPRSSIVRSTYSASADRAMSSRVRARW